METNTSPYPLRLTGELSPKLSRGLWLVKSYRPDAGSDSGSKGPRELRDFSLAPRSGNSEMVKEATT